jgi:MFS family permease
MNKWHVVILLMLLNASSMTDRQALSLVIDLIRADLSLTDTQIGLLAGPAFAVLHVAALLPFGWLIDRWSRRGIIAIGASFWSVMTACCGMAGSFSALCAARAGVGVGEATLAPSTYSMLADYFPKSQLARAISIYALGLPLGSTLALVGGGWLIGVLGDIGPMALPLLGVLQPWQIMFLIVALPGLPLALLMITLVKEPQRHRAGAVEGQVPLAVVLAYLWQHRAIYCSLLFGGGFLAIFSYGVSYWMPTTLQRVHGLSEQGSGMFMGLAIFCLSIPGTLFAGWLTDRLTLRGWNDGPLLVGMFYAAGLLVFVVGGCLMPTGILALAMIGAGMFFLNSWATGVAPALLQNVTPAPMRGRVSAIYVLVSALMGLSLGPLAVAIVTDNVFHNEAAVSQSLALIGTIAILAALIAMHFGRSSLRRYQGTAEAIAA